MHHLQSRTATIMLEAATSFFPNVVAVAPAIANLFGMVNNSRARSEQPTVREASKNWITIDKKSEQRKTELPTKAV